MTVSDEKPKLKGLLWNEIPNGSYWVAPVHDKVFGASPRVELCQILGDEGERWIDFGGDTQDFNRNWEEYVFVPFERPRLEDIDVSAGLAAFLESDDE